MRLISLILMCGVALVAAPVHAQPSSAVQTPAEQSRCRAIGESITAELDAYISAAEAGAIDDEDLAQAKDVREALNTVYIPLFADAPAPDARVKAEFTGMSLADLLDQGTNCMKPYDTGSAN